MRACADLSFACANIHRTRSLYYIILWWWLWKGPRTRQISKNANTTCVWPEGQRLSKGSIVLHWKCVASMSATVDHVHHWHWPRTTWHSPNASRFTCLSASEPFWLFTSCAEKVSKHTVYGATFTLYVNLYSCCVTDDCTVFAVLVMHFCDVCLCDYILQSHKV